MMKSSQWISILGLLALIAVAVHWAVSSAPKPQLVTTSIKPFSNATNLSPDPPTPVATQDLGYQAISNGGSVFYEPIDSTLKDDGAYGI
jgi:hypothetical protein